MTKPTHPKPGRPPRQTPRVAFTVRLEPEAAKRFREICEKNSRSQSEQIAAWVGKWR